MTFPVAFHVFGFTVSAHQALEALAYLLGFQLYLALARRWPKASPLPRMEIGYIVLAAVFGALLGSKSLAWLESLPIYWAHRNDPRVLLGGKTIVGGLLGAWLLVEWVKRRRGIDQYSGDLYVFPVITGMSIGRLGCFLHGLEDHTYGIATRLPWGVDFGDGVHRHPTQLYEVGFLLLVAAFFAERLVRRRQVGCMFSQFMGAYLSFRFLVEFIKPRFLVPGILLSPIQIACLVGMAYAFTRRNETCCTGTAVSVPPVPIAAALNPGESRFLELTASLCSKCLAKVDAKVIEEPAGIFLRKFCPEHGIEKVLIADDPEYWKMSRAIYKAPTSPLRRNTELKKGCPWDCGMCPEHEQHCCLAVVEVTEHCDQACPICYASSSRGGSHRSLDEICVMLDAVVANEGSVGVVQLSGGEPTVHPEFFEIIEEVRKRPIRHLMVNTNGRRIAEDSAFVERLASYMPGIEIYLQFDSLDADALCTIRGADFTRVREQAVRALARFGVSTTLVVTLQKGVNDREIGRILEYALSVPSIRGVTFQPVQVAGRLAGFDPKLHRLTLTEVRRAILEQHTLFRPQDIVPVPCHTDSIAMAYAVRLGKRAVPLSQIIDPSNLCARGGNTICFEQDPAIRGHLEALFSAGASPSGAASSIANLCCEGSEGLREKLDYSKVFRVIIMQFMDGFSLDLRSLKRACVQIVSPDGRLIPFDTYNLLHRKAQAEL